MFYCDHMFLNALKHSKGFLSPSFLRFNQTVIYPGGGGGIVL